LQFACDRTNAVTNHDDGSDGDDDDNDSGNDQYGGSRDYCTLGVVISGMCHIVMRVLNNKCQQQVTLLLVTSNILLLVTSKSIVGNK
jgi:hypothetical protein